LQLLLILSRHKNELQESDHTYTVTDRACGCSDLDPARDAIAEDLVKSLRRDFGIRNIEVYKIALTIKQVEEFGLTQSIDAKSLQPNV
jgi:hypothetical protein